MKISIWQQFSSNHSSSFTVIGKFPNVEEAEKAEAEIIFHMLQIALWWKNLSSNEVDKWLTQIDDYKAITPLEMALAQRYDVDWEYSIDGIDQYISINGETDRNAIQHYGQFLIINSPHMNMEYGPQPFNIWLKALGAEVACEAQSSTYPLSTLLVNVSFLCPDEGVAQTIEQEVRTYFTLSRNFTYPAPWITYYQGNLHPDAAELKRCALIKYKESQIRRQIQNSELTYLLENRDKREQIQQQLNHFFGILFGYQRLSREQARLISIAESSTNGAYTTSEIIRNGLELKMKHLNHAPTLNPRFLNIITNWLKDQGCSRIDFDVIASHYEASI